MEWQEISGNWVFVPSQPIGIIHFLGGAFVATAPHLTYRFLLEQLGKKGYVVIATPFLNTLDHKAIAVKVLNRFESILERLQRREKIEPGYLPIYGLGHSLGCKLHLLIGSLLHIERAGNILISYNNYPLKQAIPFFEQLVSPLLQGVKDLGENLSPLWKDFPANWEIDPNLELEFTPSPEETEKLIEANYNVRRNLLIRFNDDTIDQTLRLKPVLKNRFPDMVSLLHLQGNHLTPLTQDIEWEVGEVCTPFDAIGQWFKQSLSRDLLRLNKEVLRWLNPCS
jgi:hypothetical protein